MDGGEEINQLDFYHQVKQQHTILSCVDDDGMIRVTNEVENKADSAKSTPYAINKCFEHSGETSPSLVTSLAFRHRSSKTIDMATGGTDCTISLWDVNKPRNIPLSTLRISQDNNENSNKSGVNQICNPPIVHSLSWSSSGQFLSAGLGDGTCLIASLDGRRLVERCRLRNGHDASVASVLFPAFDFDSANSLSEDRLIISAGTDGSIILWDLGSTVGNKANDPRAKFEGVQSDEDITNAVNNLSLSKKISEPGILFGIPHGKKINYMTNSSGDEVALPYSLFIADTSCNVSVYTLPTL